MICCGWFLFGTPSCRSVLGAAAETEGGVRMCVGDQHPGRELRDAGLGEGWCQLRWLAQRGCTGAHQESWNEERSLGLNFIEPQAANQGIEPLGMAALQPRPALEEGVVGPTSS